MEKIFIKNRKDQKISVLIEENPNAKGLAFVMHGLGGFKEQDHIQTFADAFLENDYTVIRFDTTNTIGESDGQYEDATITNYYADLEDVIEWAKDQDWYQEPFVLCGHSLGGICTALFSEKYAEKVKALAPISSTVIGDYKIDRTPKEELDEWKKTGFLITKSTSKPGVVKKLKWSHMEDRKKYNLLPDAHKLTMPVLLMVGDKDEVTPLDQQQMLFDSVAGRKELHIIKNAPHTYREKEHLDEIKSILDKWIKSLE